MSASTTSYLEQDRSALNDQVVRFVAPDKRKVPLGPEVRTWNREDIEAGHGAHRQRPTVLESQLHELNWRTNVSDDEQITSGLLREIRVHPRSCRISRLAAAARQPLLKRTRQQRKFLMSCMTRRVAVVPLGPRT